MNAAGPSIGIEGDVIAGVDHALPSFPSSGLGSAPQVINCEGPSTVLASADTAPFNPDTNGLETDP